MRLRRFAGKCGHVVKILHGIFHSSCDIEAPTATKSIRQCGCHLGRDQIADVAVEGRHFLDPGRGRKLYSGRAKT